jgi:putative alpha-1,2-mannosidase
MSRLYGMGEYGLALSGMDDAGEMSSWYVFSALGLYPYSPADESYIVSVPLFDQVNFELGDKTLTIVKKNAGRKLTEITYDDNKVDGYFVSHHELIKGKKLVIVTG